MSSDVPTLGRIAPAALGLTTRPKHRWARGSLLAAIALGLAGGVYGLVSTRTKAPPPLDLTKVAIDRGPITAKVTASGVVSALVTVQVGSQVSGRIASIGVDFNSAVKRGQILARLDPGLFEAAIEQARGNLVAAEANVYKLAVQADVARRASARSRGLAGDRLVSDADYEAAEGNAEAANAQVGAAEGTLAQAKAALHQAELNLSYATIRSPIDGIVISRNVDVGQTVAASFAAPVLFVLAEDLRKMQVDTNVAEADVGRLAPGGPATFVVDAHPGRVFEGKIRQIRNAAQMVQNVVTYDAVIDVQNPELLLRPGMTANVSFVFAAKEDVLRVPNAALRFRPSPGFGGVENANGKPSAADRRIIWVLDGGGPRPREIQIGISDGVKTEVVSGRLQAGDEVVTDAANTGPARGFRFL